MAYQQFHGYPPMYGQEDDTNQHQQQYGTEAAQSSCQYGAQPEWQQWPNAQVSEDSYDHGHGNLSGHSYQYHETFAAPAHCPSLPQHANVYQGQLYGYSPVQHANYETSQAYGTDSYTVYAQPNHAYSYGAVQHGTIYAPTVAPSPPSACQDCQWFNGHAANCPASAGNQDIGNHASNMPNFAPYHPTGAYGGLSAYNSTLASTINSGSTAAPVPQPATPGSPLTPPAKPHKPGKHHGDGKGWTIAGTVTGFVTGVGALVEGGLALAK